MNAIDRNPDACTNERFDIVIIGGGIYGACSLLEASRRGLRPLMIERDDFGGATSWNSLRIIHGGLRYLQNADLSRFRRSVAEQAWWLMNFPDLVQPMSCLMPLYNRGLRRRSIMRCALKLNDYLGDAVRRKCYGDSSIGIKPGQIVDVAETVRRFPLANSQGLKGGAVWNDARMESPQRLIIEVLRWAMAAGGKALNYMNCTGLLQAGGKVIGVKATCSVSQNDFEFLADEVINCAGPWASQFSQTKPGGSEHEFAVAFNVVIDHPPPSKDALAVTPPKPGASTYFVVPLKNQMIVGTSYLPANHAGEPTKAHVAALLEELRSATGIRVDSAQVVQVLPGRLPTSAIGSHLPAKSPRITPAIAVGGPRGLTTVSGVKYTTARHLAEKALGKIYRLKNIELPKYTNIGRPSPAVHPSIEMDRVPTVQELQNWIRDESVVYIDDLLLRRCDLFTNENRRIVIAKQLLERIRWTDANEAEQLARLKTTPQR